MTFQQYIYGLGLTLFRHLLPRKYWLNFCRLVAGVRILQRHSIAHRDLIEGHRLLIEFACEFEELYYQRMEARLHFVRQSIHLLTYMGPETFQIGPLACYAQWTLETAIGNLGCEIRQDRDLYANLTQRAVMRAQVNSLHACFPQIEFEMGSGSSRSTNKHEFDGGFVFLLCCEEYPSPLSENELTTFQNYWRKQPWLSADIWPNEVCCWAKLQLPNGQKAQLIWYESTLNTKVCRASCVEVSFSDGSKGCSLLMCTIQFRQDDGTRIGNIPFYFYICFGDNRYPLAVATMFTLPDASVFADSSETVYLSEPMSTQDGVVVIPITAIHSVVSMFPDMRITDDGRILETGKFSLVRHAFLELAQF